MNFLRTLLGDMPADALGACDAHEHVAITGRFSEQHFPEFLLNDPQAAAVDLGEFKQAGGGWIVDTMPTGPGRDARLLTEISRQNDVPIVCPTGLHLAKYYPEDDPLLILDREELTDRFIREINEGLDDGEGVLPQRDSESKKVAFRSAKVASGNATFAEQKAAMERAPEAHQKQGRAGIVKIAGDRDRLSDHQRQVFAAAADAHRATGCPIITHTEQGTAGLEQVELLRDGGVDLQHVALSHCDREPDIGYHRDLLQSGVTLEYDNHFRELARGKPCVSADLIANLAPEFPDQIVVGMDMARRSYWHGYGGSPGMAWLLTDFPKHLASAGVEESLVHRLYHENPARVFSFVRPHRRLPLRESNEP